MDLVLNWKSLIFILFSFRLSFLMGNAIQSIVFLFKIKCRNKLKYKQVDSSNLAPNRRSQMNWSKQKRKKYIFDQINWNVNQVHFSLLDNNKKKKTRFEYVAHELRIDKNCLTNYFFLRFTSILQTNYFHSVGRLWRIYYDMVNEMKLFNWKQNSLLQNWVKRKKKYERKYNLFDKKNEKSSVQLTLNVIYHKKCFFLKEKKTDRRKREPKLSSHFLKAKHFDYL